MGRYDKFLQRILAGRSDAAIPFADLCNLLRRLGFTERTRGSHHIFTRRDVSERLNLQRHGHEAKGYQVRDVRGILKKYGLHGGS